MNKRQIALVVLLVVLPWILTALLDAAEVEDRYWKIEKVADGVWAALQPHDNRFNDANVIVIQRDDDLVVIDSPANADAPLGAPGRIQTLLSYHNAYTRTLIWIALPGAEPDSQLIRLTR